MCTCFAQSGLLNACYSIACYRLVCTRSVDLPNTHTNAGNLLSHRPWRPVCRFLSGLWAGSQKASPAPSITYKYATAMAKGKKGGFALKGGNAQEGGLQTLYEGQRPAGYETMNKQGAIILGIGGDNSCGAIGT